VIPESKFNIQPIRRRQILDQGFLCRDSRAHCRLQEILTRLISTYGSLPQYLSMYAGHISRTCKKHIYHLSLGMLLGDLIASHYFFSTFYTLNYNKNRNRVDHIYVKATSTLHTLSSRSIYAALT
jgi:hypothetical protein